MRVSATREPIRKYDGAVVLVLTTMALLSPSFLTFCSKMRSAGFDPKVIRVDPYVNVLYYDAGSASPLSWDIDHWFPCSSTLSSLLVYFYSLDYVFAFHLASFLQY
ncbi:hypothetical protein HRI_002280700 [Hibiscus trionum]|uniref:Uncharacterized protein n=1 Tax=Hibiscus trionum TaxID=183268 RepID=A0A9W7HX82_HIBTR|nr:hypothetical protein HRI_002280700 [Hibiscus trionum]